MLLSRSAQIASYVFFGKTNKTRFIKNCCSLQDKSEEFPNLWSGSSSTFLFRNEVMYRSDWFIGRRNRFYSIGVFCQWKEKKEEEEEVTNWVMYRSDWYVCVYDKHLLAGQDIQYLAPNSRSRYTTPFDEIIKKNARLNNNQLITHFTCPLLTENTTIHCE